MSVNMPGPAAVTGTAPANERGQGYTLRDFLIIASYHQRLIVSVLLISIAVAVAGWMMSPVRYTAKSQLLVLFGREQSGAQGLSDIPSVLSIDGVRATQSEVEFLRDRGVIRSMVEHVGVAKLNPQIAERRLLGLLPPVPEAAWLETTVDLVAQRWLSVSTEPASNLVVISFEHMDRAVAIEAVNALIDFYLQRRIEIFRNLRSPFLRESAKSYADQLAQIESEIRARKLEFNVLNLEQEILLALNQVDSIAQRRQYQMERRETLVAEIAATEMRLKDLPARVFDYQEKSNRVDNDDTDNLLTKLYLERDTLRARYQDSDSRLEDVLRQIKVLEDLRTQPKRDFMTAREIRNPTLDFMINHLYQLKVEADSAVRSVDELNRQSTESQKRVTDLRAAEGILLSLERSRVILEQLYRDANSRAEAAQLDESAAAVRTANIRIVEQADASLRGRSNGLNIALASLVGGIMIAGALTLLAAWNRRVFLLPQEVSRSLGMPVLATFSDENGFRSSEGQAQVIYLAGQLVFGQNQSGRAAAIQVISSGKSERRRDFVAALAMELAQGQSKRTLLLDLVGEGSVHWTRFGGKAPNPHAGGEVQIAATDVPRLHVSVGAPTGQVNWLRANGEAFKTLFTKLGSTYDMIVIDAPPAHDSLVGLRLANIVDGSILVVRAEFTRVPVAENLRNQLLSAGGDIYGAIITGRKFRIPKAIYQWF